MEDELGFIVDGGVKKSPDKALKIGDSLAVGQGTGSSYSLCKRREMLGSLGVQAC